MGCPDFWDTPYCIFVHEFQFLFNLKIVYNMTTLLLTTMVVVGFAGLWTGVVAVSDYVVSVVAKWLKNYTGEPTLLCKNGGVSA